MFARLQKLLLGNLRKQLTVGMVLVAITTITLLVWDVTRRQQANEIDSHSEQIKAVANGVATSSAVWVISRDYSGLQEIVEGISRYPNLRYAIVLDLRGQVLAHNDATKVGLYLTDLPQQPRGLVLKHTVSLIDVITPIMLANKQIGWVRIGLDRAPYTAQIDEMRRKGIVYGLLAIALSIVFATLASKYLTRRLYTIQQVAEAVREGKSKLRTVILGDDEAAMLARQFNEMLDSLEQREDQLRSFYDLDLVGLTITSTEKGWVRINQTLCKMLEYSEQELRGMTWAELTHPDDLAADVEQFNRMLANEIDGYSLEKRFVSRSGRVIPTRLVVGCIRRPDGKVDYVTAMVEDLTEAKKAENEIMHLAFYDTLTGLPNRRLLIDRLKQALASSARTGKEGALLFIDLDDFKMLNDTLGHDIGDQLLQQVALRLESCVRAGDSVARLGGDEFVVMLENLDEEPTEAAAQAEVVGEKILVTLNKPYLLGTHSHINTPSIGATLFNNHKSSIEELLKQADIAMYQAKHSGRNTLRFFDPKMQDIINTRAAQEGDLRKALEGQQFELYYQLQATHNRKIVSAEVLIRWQHPERGMVSPLNFIPLAEETGLILPIGQWVLETACTQLMKWQNDPFASHLLLAVNVSARQFHKPDFVEQVLAVLDKTGIDPSKLKLELTESLVLENIDDAIIKMDALRAVGVCFSMDDFGTGFSSLAYLTRLPLSQLKIDQSFVRNLGVKPSDAVIVQTIIGMAKNLEMGVIAEGVETEEQRAFLETHGCPQCQGYLFSRPVPLAEFEELLRKG